MTTQPLTADDLRALPIGSAVLAKDGRIWQRVNASIWQSTGSPYRLRSARLADQHEPTRVVWTPEPETTA